VPDPKGGTVDMSQRRRRLVRRFLTVVEEIAQTIACVGIAEWVPRSVAAEALRELIEETEVRLDGNHWKGRGLVLAREYS
jgi:hypothetical protein